MITSHSDSSARWQCLLYNIYGPAGARETAAARRLLRNLLFAVSGDAGRRALPTILVGDLNAEIEGTTFLQTLISTQWNDMAVLHDGSPPFTCHKGSGSRIDHIWCSDSCLPVSCHFGIETNPFTDHVHAILELGFWNQQQSVERLAPRQSYSFDHLTTPEQAIDFYMPDESYSALNIQDVNKAAAIRSRQAEAILVQLPISMWKPSS